MILLITSTRKGSIFAGINSNQFHIFLIVTCQGFVSKQQEKFRQDCVISSCQTEDTDSPAKFVNKTS